MEPLFKRVIFLDEWVELPPIRPAFLAWPIIIWRELFPPLAVRTYQFKNYALGYKWTATDRELELIRTNRMFGHIAFRLHDNFNPLTFADLLGPEFIPEVNPSQAELLKTETRVREAAFKWTLFFENLDWSS